MRPPAAAGQWALLSVSPWRIFWRSAWAPRRGQVPLLELPLQVSSITAIGIETMAARLRRQRSDTGGPLSPQRRNGHAALCRFDGLAMKSRDARNTVLPAFWPSTWHPKPSGNVLKIYGEIVKMSIRCYLVLRSGTTSAFGLPVTMAPTRSRPRAADLQTSAHTSRSSADSSGPAGRR
jgi:hypothetical protein